MGNNYVDNFDLLEELAKLSGTTGKQAYDSGTIGDILQNAEKQLGGKPSKWNYIYNESGKMANVIGKNGKFLTSTSGTKWTGTQQMGTQIVTTTSPKTVEVLTGDVLDSTGQVIKKGLVPGAVKGANALTGGLAVLGGIATGVQWYKDNPELWTDLGLKLFQWTYDDPYDKSWNDILYDALVPTAVDSDGTTYLNENYLESLSQGLIDMGFFKPSYNSTVQDKYVTTSTVYKEDPSSFIGIKFFLMNSDYIFYNYGNQQQKTVVTSSSSPVYMVAPCWRWDDKINITPSLISLEPFTFNLEKYINGVISEILPRTAGVTTDKSRTYSYYRFQLINAGGLDAFPTLTPSYLDFKPYTYDINDALFLAMYGVITSSIINTGLQDGATFPEKNVPLSTTFPDWANNAVETVDPNSTPENPTYQKWYPVNIPDTSTAEEGKTPPDVKQEDAQKGTVTEEDKKKIMDIIQDAISSTVIPWSPELPSDPDGTVPDKPQPNPPESTVPALGGTADGLWQMYNPTKAELNLFGKWLWSENALDLIKRIFANSPMEAIIGLHAIFATPITEGRDSIKCGYLDSEVESNLVKEQYTTIDCGTVYVPPYYNNALDYGNTSAHIYLPFIGIQELSIYDIMDKDVNVSYTVDVLTGTILAQITVTANNYRAVLYTFNGSCSIEYPLTSGNRASQVLSAITGAVAGVSKLSVPAMAMGAIAGATRGADVQMSGTLSSNAGAMGIRNPYLIIKHPVAYDALDYNKLYGYPNNVTAILNTLKGYTRIKSVHVDKIPCTDEEKQMIESLLKQGIIIS